jgi:hypothetical protein
VLATKKVEDLFKLSKAGGLLSGYVRNVPTVLSLENKLIEHITELCKSDGGYFQPIENGRVKTVSHKFMKLELLHSSIKTPPESI